MEFKQSDKYFKEYNDMIKKNFEKRRKEGKIRGEQSDDGLLLYWEDYLTIDDKTGASIVNRDYTDRHGDEYDHEDVTEEYED